jgi:hypothetical protein
MDGENATKLGSKEEKRRVGGDRWKKTSPYQPIGIIF